MSEVAIDTGWVNMCPFLQIEPPHPLAGDHEAATKDVREIYDFFKGENPSNPMSAFKTIYNRLPVIPEAGERKLAQMLKVVKLMKISRDAMATRRNTLRALKNLGVK